MLNQTACNVYGNDVRVIHAYDKDGWTYIHFEPLEQSGLHRIIKLGEKTDSPVTIHSHHRNKFQYVIKIKIKD